MMFSKWLQHEPQEYYNIIPTNQINTVKTNLEPSKCRFLVKLTAQTKVRRSLKLRVAIAQFQTKAQRVENELKNFNFFVWL